MKKTVSIILMFVVSATAICRDIYGYIYDANGKPIPNAVVRIMQKNKVALIGLTETDSTGLFRAKHIPEDTIVLAVSSIGFESKEVELYRYTCPLKIYLVEQVQTLDEVTVTANSTLLHKNKVSFFPSKKEKRISNGGYYLLYNMPISVLSVDPLSKSIVNNTGDGVETFINGIPATSTEVQNIRAEDVKKIEYLEQPSDPRFNNARYALNIVVANYDKGGYTKMDGQQRFVTTLGSYTLYSHYESGKMIYDLLGGFDFNRQTHLGEVSGTHYDFEDLKMDKDESKSGRSKNRQGYATFRAKYVADSMIIANSVGIQINRTPYINMSGNTSMVSDDTGIADELTFDSHQHERYYSVEWNGNYYFRLKNGFDLTSDLSASYMNTAQDYNYLTSEEYSITNDIEEDAWNLKWNATLRKRMKNISLGLNLLSSFNGNSICYRGTTPSDISVRDCYIIPRLVFNYSKDKFRVNGNLGVSYESATYNGQREVYFFPKSFISGGWNFDARNALSFSFEYSMFGNSLGMKSPNLIMTDNTTAMQGNPELKNFHFISPTISYRIVPDKKTTISIFTRWQYFNHPSVYIWNPAVYDGRTVVVRSYTNTGYLSNLRLGISGTLRFLDNNLFVKGSVTQNYFKQGGLTAVNSWPVSVSGQANYYIKNFSISAFWEKASKNVSIFETKKWPQNYFLAFSYGNGNFIATFTCRNMFNNSWRSSERQYRSIPVNYNVRNYGNEYHRSFVLSLSYSFSYGKKTNMNDRVSKSGMPNTAIIE